LFDDFFYFNQNLTLTTPAPATLEENAYNMSKIIAINFADSVLNCYLYSDALNTAGVKWVSSFSDFTDIATSFIFNLLAQSLKIRSLIT
jgi:hypothetical protein